jgi:hypothetical protein
MRSKSLIQLFGRAPRRARPFFAPLREKKLTQSHEATKKSLRVFVPSCEPKSQTKKGRPAGPPFLFAAGKPVRKSSSR